MIRHTVFFIMAGLILEVLLWCSPFIALHNEYEVYQPMDYPLIIAGSSQIIIIIMFFCRTS